MKKASTEELVTAYKELGTVWKVAKRFGMCGQSVWERLRRLGVAMASTKWTGEERTEAARLAESGCSIGEIAERLNRPYAGVAGMLSEAGIRIRRRRRGQWRQPRTLIATPWNAMCWMLRLQQSGLTIRRFARANGLDIDTVVSALQQHQPEFWHRYVQMHAIAPARACPNCDTMFYPLNGKQRTCSRRCQAHYRADRAYFGGQRRNASGLAAGVCQLCFCSDKPVSVHHDLGKEHDPENLFLTALCAGCHHVVGLLGARGFVDSSDGWERLITLVLARRVTDANTANGTQFVGFHACVDIDRLTQDDVDQLEEVRA